VCLLCGEQQRSYSFVVALYSGGISSYDCSGHGDGIAYEGIYRKVLNGGWVLKSFRTYLGEGIVPQSAGK
jgi:hypothetical protein